MTPNQYIEHLSSRDQSSWFHKEQVKEIVAVILKAINFEEVEIELKEKEK